MYVLGLDYGTGGGKVALVDASAHVVGYAFQEYSIFTDHPGWSEHDPNAYWDLACTLIPKVLEQAGISADQVKAVAVSSAMPSMVMVDEAGDPVARAYNLMDRRATEEVQWLRRTIGDEKIFEISKNRLDDHPMIVNLLWEKNNRPDVFARIHKALSVDGFITAKLTGNYTGHYSGAAFYGVAYDLLNRKFDREILEKIGLSESLFPTLYRCEQIVGNTTEKASRACSLAIGTPVCAGQVDCNAAWSGAGAIEAGDIQMNLGTCGNFGIIHDKPVFHDSMIAFNYTTDSEHTYITVPTTTTGGYLIRYLRDNYFKIETEQQAAQGKDVYDLINLEAAAVPPGSEGLVILPYIMGERTPIWDVYARGVVFGLSLHHTRGHLVRAMMESVAYALYDSFSLIRDTGIDIHTPIVLNEGGAKSELWRRIITDVFNCPTVMVENRVGAPYGDALLAGIAIGMFKDYSIAKEKASYVNRMEPDSERHALYMDYFKLYKDLYGHVKQDFRTLSGLAKRYAIT
ncbi:MAG: FGGY-family carbohydrate kinase [Sphaerochaeta sp.]|nr:FGGY-family carbohydrate kinase [Sphaerochaeta sp.]